MGDGRQGAAGHTDLGLGFQNYAWFRSETYNIGPRKSSGKTAELSCSPCAGGSRGVWLEEPGAAGGGPRRDLGPSAGPTGPFRAAEESWPKGSGRGSSLLGFTFIHLFPKMRNGKRESFPWTARKGCHASAWLGGAGGSVDSESHLQV